MEDTLTPAGIGVKMLVSSIHRMAGDVAELQDAMAGFAPPSATSIRTRIQVNVEPLFAVEVAGADRPATPESSFADAIDQFVMSSRAALGALDTHIAGSGTDPLPKRRVLAACSSATRLRALAARMTEVMRSDGGQTTTPAVTSDELRAARAAAAARSPSLRRSDAQERLMQELGGFQDEFAVSSPPGASAPCTFGEFRDFLDRRAMHVLALLRENKAQAYLGKQYLPFKTSDEALLAALAPKQARSARSATEVLRSLADIYRFTAEEMRGGSTPFSFADEAALSGFERSIDRARFTTEGGGDVNSGTVSRNFEAIAATVLQAAWLYKRFHGILPLTEDTIRRASRLGSVMECGERIVLWRHKTDPEAGKTSSTNWHSVLSRLASNKNGRCPITKHKHTWSKCPDIKGRLRTLLELCGDA